MTFLVITTALLLALGTIGYLCCHLYLQYRGKLRSETAEIKRLLTEELNSKGLQRFNLQSFMETEGTTPNILRTVSVELYTELWSKVLEDSVITSDEKNSLNKLAIALQLDLETRQAIESKMKREKYSTAVNTLLQTSSIGNAEVSNMKKLRQNLGLTKADISAASGKETKDAYLALFRQVIDNSVIELEQLRQLTDFRNAFDLDEKEANRHIQKHAIKLYREWFYAIVNSGEVNPAQESTLATLAKLFDIPSDIVDQHHAMLLQIKKLAEYRQGNIPAIGSKRMLESGECCYVDEECVYSWQTSRQTKSVSGALIVTNNRIIFTSGLKNFEFKPHKIVDIDLLNERHIELSVSSARGAGMYRTNQAQKIAAILEGIVKKHNYILSESYSNAKTRHIPSSVRREVWQRDNGACVQCKATEYLEYDHVIPFSKGGANSIANVQLLCRKCNNEKSNRI